MNLGTIPDPKSPLADAPSEGGPYTGMLIELVREMRGQRESFDAAQRLAAAERKAERRWRMLFQALVFGVPVILGIVYFLFFLSSTGFRWGPFGSVVGIVRIEGPIASGERASADVIIPILEKAFANPSVQAVVLAIDSPGGTPVESERIYTALGTLKKMHPKPVAAVINNIGASAAFMIALHADKIIAGKYSLVGSIGAIIAPWQLDRAIGRFDIAQKVYASGKLKSFLNPFTPGSAEGDAKAQQLVDQLGQQFLDEVKARRGERLKAGVDFGTGEIWAGSEAKALGLIDGVGTLEEYISTTWSVGRYEFGPEPAGFQLLGKTLQNAITASLERVATAGPIVR